ncbi:gluconokinase [Pseudooctadecabacter jejudonensis]|uniref:Gluconokinase n=1 Tax=Pseudooctadecabacter jejudonensis TaxID=1391910 RepID=A0A1Y5S2H0_9RHOB|nr:gluconokinase [Pseudooctadecabacter jejudonensis]SLN31065.1 Thermoresistant gluconokinase [Pseudooctadecabacter jejudonensis]
MKIVVMGVAGCGKTTLGVAAAQELEAVFIDADDLHPQDNIDHMSAGKPLTDEMRWPWLDACGEALRSHDRIVLGCSALRRSYRDHLRNYVPDFRLVYPRVTEETIRDRFKRRTGHFMPERLISSQFRTLEPPTIDENPILMPASLPVQRAARLVASIVLAK